MRRMSRSRLSDVSGLLPEGHPPGGSTLGARVDTKRGRYWYKVFVLRKAYHVTADEGPITAGESGAQRHRFPCLPPEARGQETRERRLRATRGQTSCSLTLGPRVDNKVMLGINKHEPDGRDFNHNLQ